MDRPAPLFRKGAAIARSFGKKPIQKLVDVRRPFEVPVGVFRFPGDVDAPEEPREGFGAAGNFFEVRPHHLAILEEDVPPHGRISLGDAGEVFEPSRREVVVPVALASPLEDHVHEEGGDHVGR